MAHTVNRTFLHDGYFEGSVHQESHIFNATGRGFQCVPNALCSLLKSTQKFPNTWTTSDFDEVLYRGNMLYKQIGKIGKLLLPSDIPKCITVDGVNYKVHERLSHWFIYSGK